MSETNFISGYFVLTDRSKQSDMYSMSILILNDITKINLVFKNTRLTLADTWVIYDGSFRNNQKMRRFSQKGLLP